MTFPESRIVCVFEPRTHSSRKKVFEKEYISSFQNADIIFLLPAYGKSNLKNDEAISEDFIVTSLKMNGKIAYPLDGYRDILKIKNSLKEGDVVIFMSSGDMEGMPYLLLESIQKG